MQIHNEADTHTQLRALYRSLVDHEDRFHEFKQLLALYPNGADESAESGEAAEVREQLNGRIREWVGHNFGGLSASWSVACSCIASHRTR